MARDADLAILAKDKTTKEQFNILTHSWTSCGLSLYAEDWEAVLNPKVEEPKNFGAIVEASSYGTDTKRQKWMRDGKGTWRSEDGTWTLNWRDLINPVVISEGQK